MNPLATVTPADILSCYEALGSTFVSPAVKLPLALAALALLHVPAQAEVDLGTRVMETPYDPYFHAVREVVRKNRAAAPEMQHVRELLKAAHAFRYKYYDSLVPAHPNTTERTRTGDCKDKALWLCRAVGDPSTRFVIGKWRRTSHVSHAWILWRKDGRWWILDPTNATEPLSADKVGRDCYLPRYSWDRTGKYVHKWEFRYHGVLPRASNPTQREPVIGNL